MIVCMCSALKWVFVIQPLPVFCWSTGCPCYFGVLAVLGFVLVLIVFFCCVCFCFIACMMNLVHFGLPTCKSSLFGLMLAYAGQSYNKCLAVSSVLLHISHFALVLILYLCKYLLKFPWSVYTCVSQEFIGMYLLSTCGINSFVHFPLLVLDHSFCYSWMVSVCRYRVISDFLCISSGIVFGNGNVGVMFLVLSYVIVLLMISLLSEGGMMLFYNL